MAIQQDQLYKAFSVFIEAFRTYSSSVLEQKFGDKWPADFTICLTPDQKFIWDQGLKNGSNPMNLIDYNHLKSFAIKFRDLLKDDFKKNTMSLPTWLDEIYQLRNKIAHFDTDLDQDDITKVWIHMKTIAKLAKMQDLEKELNSIQNSEVTKPEVIAAETQPFTQSTGTLKPWFHMVQPHFDIRQGRLDESVFAANLAEVALETGREIYRDPNMFFSKTFFTSGLKTVAKRVISGLNGTVDAENRVISLQTGFGGGKTHTLISIFHLAKWGNKAAQSPFTSALLNETGTPQFETASIAVFTNTTNDVVQGREVKEGFKIHTLWGEIAYQLGGVAAYENALYN